MDVEKRVVLAAKILIVNQYCRACILNAFMKLVEHLSGIKVSEND